MYFSNIILGMLEELLCSGVLCYMDDIIIHSASKEEHNKQIRRVLEKLSMFEKFLGPNVSQNSPEME